ncbi:MAG: hypothetical protein M3Y53_05085 [Thermoproteota archaeon]|nr:hypothetical protein [Thermoproteota archaeon]
MLPQSFLVIKMDISLDSEQLRALNWRASNKDIAGVVALLVVAKQQWEAPWLSEPSEMPEDKAMKFDLLIDSGVDGTPGLSYHHLVRRFH